MMNQPATLSHSGTAAPGSPIIERAIGLARERCEDYLFNHVMRSWLFAERLAEARGLAHDPEVVAVSVLLHDLTLNREFAGPRRFEVEAADIAREFAADTGFDDRRAQLVWDAVALNSTPSIGLHKEPEVALATAGICLDVVGLQYDLLQPAEIDAIVGEFPRLQMKRRMTDCFCHMAAKLPETAYGSFLADFGQRFVPGFTPPSSVDLLAGAPFSE